MSDNPLPHPLLIPKYPPPLEVPRSLVYSGVVGGGPLWVTSAEPVFNGQLHVLWSRDRPVAVLTEEELVTGDYQPAKHSLNIGTRSVSSEDVIIELVSVCIHRLVAQWGKGQVVILAGPTESPTFSNSLSQRGLAVRTVNVTEDPHPTIYPGECAIVPNRGGFLAETLANVTRCGKVINLVLNKESERDHGMNYLLKNITIVNFNLADIKCPSNWSSIRKSLLVLPKCDETEAKDSLVKDVDSGTERDTWSLTAYSKDPLVRRAIENFFRYKTCYSLTTGNSFEDQGGDSVILSSGSREMVDVKVSPNNISSLFTWMESAFKGLKPPISSRILFET